MPRITAMRAISTLLFVGALVGDRAIATADPHDTFGTPAAMDGPVEDPCKALHREDGEACARMASWTSGSLAIAVYLVGPKPDDPKGQRDGRYYVAIRPDQHHWWLAHDPIEVAPYWREHGPGHTWIATDPHLTTLALADKRPAIAVDIPIDDLTDGCNDAGDPSPKGDLATCRRKVDQQRAARIAELRRSKREPKESPTATIACGQRADLTWACIAPLTTHMTHAPIERFAHDGRWRGGDAVSF